MGVRKPYDDPIGVGGVYESRRDDDDDDDDDGVSCASCAVLYVS